MNEIQETAPAAPVEGDNPYQRTADWFAARCGCLTASRCADALKTLRDGKRSLQSIKIMETIIAERLTGNCEQTFETAAMRWGTEHEADALAAYEAETGEIVTLTGFVHHPKIEWLGASPDGLVGQDGLIEIKCPATTTHVHRLMRPQDGADQYRDQMLCQLICTGRKWVDFVDFDPRIRDERLQMLIVRFEPKQEERDEFEEKCALFLAEVDGWIKTLKN